MAVSSVWVCPDGYDAPSTRAFQATLDNRSQLGSRQRGPLGSNLNARETGRDAAPAPWRTADAVPKGYSDWVHQARVFPGPQGSKAARSLVYTHSGDIYKRSE